MRQDLSKFIDDAVTTQARLDITRNSKRVAVLLSADDYDSLLETLDVLADAELVRDIHEALTGAETGETFSHEQVLADLAARRAAAR